MKNIIIKGIITIVFSCAGVFATHVMNTKLDDIDKESK